MQTCILFAEHGVEQPFLWPFDHLKQISLPSAVVVNKPLEFFLGCSPMLVPLLLAWIGLGCGGCLDCCCP